MGNFRAKLGIEPKSDLKVALTRTRFHAVQSTGENWQAYPQHAVVGEFAGSGIRKALSDRVLDIGGRVMKSVVSEGDSRVGHENGSMAMLALGALGVVYGDIGTSPLYAVNECFSHHGVAPTHANVLGILSLFVWSLFLVIVVKYITFIMRADNQGEGGILALLALYKNGGPPSNTKKIGGLVLLGLFGAALLYGDGMITPAISVLSAFEGLEVGTPFFRPYVIPLTILVLVILFAVQRRGTAGIGKVFGPATLLWFLSIAAAGLPWIVKNPEILAAVNPIHAVRYFMNNGFHGFRTLGSVVLCITGGEALYADMGHFGRKPIKWAWYGVVLPALLMNYLGQGAYLLGHPGFEQGGNIFFALVRPWGIGLYGEVVLANIATVVASQALISGAYSLTQQAMQLGFWPRFTITHTSSDQEGQIYCPEINWMLAIACVALVLGFRSSTNLAAAYGIAVTGTMGITSVLFYAVARKMWHWSFWKAGGLLILFLTVDLTFFAANAMKIFAGGYVPAVIALGMFTIMTTWQMGRHALYKQLAREGDMPIIDLIRNMLADPSTVRTRRTSVFMVSSLNTSSYLLGHFSKNLGCLPEQLIFLTVCNKRRPWAEKPITRLEQVAEGVWFVEAACGYMEKPDVPQFLEIARQQGLPVNLSKVSYFLGRETLVESGRSGLSWGRRAFFRLLTLGSRPAHLAFGLPPGQVGEFGIQIEL